MVGPPLQGHISEIMIRSRTHKKAFTVDIAKMDRQIQVKAPDADLQRIMWRINSSEPIQH